MAAADTTSSQWGTSLLTWAAWAVSLAALSGSLALSIVLGLKACPLCLYQRAFIMGVVGILGIGISLRGWRQGTVSLLALPLAAASLGVVLFHDHLFETGRVESPLGLSRVLTAPQESLAAHVLLLGLLLIDVLRHRTGSNISLSAVAGALLLGALFTAGAILGLPAGV
jgi:disulfide bond formation protein DsbB